MAVKRKNTTGIFAPKNRKFLIAGGVAAIAGIYLLAGDKIKDLFKKDTSDQLDIPTPDAVIAPAPDPVIINQPIVTQSNDTDDINLDKRLLVGVKGNEVKRLQMIINDQLSKIGYKKGDNPESGKQFTYPLTTDGNFGVQTYNASFSLFPFFEKKGYITLDQARYDWARYYGTQGFEFPPSLRNSRRYERYATAYKTGKIDAQK